MCRNLIHDYACFLVYNSNINFKLCENCHYFCIIFLFLEKLEYE